MQVKMSANVNKWDDLNWTETLQNIEQSINVLFNNIMLCDTLHNLGENTEEIMTAFKHFWTWSQNSFLIHAGLLHYAYCYQ